MKKKMMSALMSAMVLAALMVAMVIPATAAEAPAWVDAPAYPAASFRLPTVNPVAGYANSDVHVYRLATATKMAILAENIYPLNRADEALALMMKFNDPEALKGLTYSGQQKSIWDMLTVDTQKKAKKMSTYELLTYVQTTAEYKKDSVLKKYVDAYLDQTMSGESLRYALSPLGYDESLKELNPNELILAAGDILSRSEVRAVIDAMAPLEYTNMDEYAYSQLDPERLEEIYAGVKTAAEAIWPEVVQSVEQFCFVTAPVEVE